MTNQQEESLSASLVKLPQKQWQTLPNCAMEVLVSAIRSGYLFTTKAAQYTLSSLLDTWWPATLLSEMAKAEFQYMAQPSNLKTLTLTMRSTSYLLSGTIRTPL